MVVQLVPFMRGRDRTLLITTVKVQGCEDHRGQRRQTLVMVLRS